MAEIVVTQDEMALRRRARRRLVGAVAIALTSFVVLPMLFDGEPKPLGPDVEIRIPAQNSAFEPTQPVIPRAPLEDEFAEANQLAKTQSAEPTQPLLPAPTLEPGAPPVVPVMPEKQVQPAREPAKPEQKTQVAVAQPVEKISPKPEVKPPPKPEVKPPPKPEVKPPLKPDQTFASQGYFLQLGAFTKPSNAHQLHEKAIAAGFNAVLVTTNNQYRVRVGPIPQHDKAKEMQARLKAKGFSPVLLGP
jgi:DedD protein